MPRIRRSVVTALAVGGFAALSATPAFATGYTPSGPPAGGGAGGSFGSVAGTCTTQPSGGPCVLVVDGRTVTFSVPPGTFSQPTQIVLTGGQLSNLGNGGVTGTHGVFAFGINFVQNGNPVTGTFAHTVTVRITGPGLAPTDQLVEFLPGGATSVVSGATFGVGALTFGIVSDPDYEVVAINAAAAPVAGGTTAPTGVPVQGELTLAGVLAALGAGVLVRRRRALRSGA